MFDGTILSLPDSCGHVLFQESRDNLIKISTRNSNCDSLDCNLSIVMEVEDEEYVISNINGSARVTSLGESLEVPGVKRGIIFELVGDWLIVEVPGLGFSLHWNNKEFLEIKLSQLLWNRTAGLCGTLTDNPFDDQVNIDGQTATGFTNFVSSWSSGTDEECETSSIEALCNDETVKEESTTFCQKFLFNEALQECQKVLNPFPYFETCKRSYCQSKSNGGTRDVVPCQTVESYVKACRSKGISIENWRQDGFCGK